jgi:CRP-like cAMP-binding protein
MPEPVDRRVLKSLVPPGPLTEQSFEEVTRNAVIETLAAGRTLFRAGDLDRKAVYLLAGEVELLDDRGGRERVRAGTDAARYPLANEQPRAVTARARTEISVTRFDSDLLDVYLTWDQVGGIEVSELVAEATVPAVEEGADWMTRLLRSRLLMRIPPANIQRLFMRLEEVTCRAGEAVVRQGEEGDFYYIVSRGRCRVTRTSTTGREVTLAELTQGDAFGEEALLAGQRRNATVTMLSDGSLMRLSKSDFEELLKAPLQKEVDFEQARALIRAGAVLLDVRMESEYRTGNIRGSVNLPIYMLRMRAPTLDRTQRYVVYCDTGRRSSAAAYLLTERGFDACVLRGGLLALPRAAPGATPARG